MAAIGGNRLGARAHRQHTIPDVLDLAAQGLAHGCLVVRQQDQTTATRHGGTGRGRRRGCRGGLGGRPRPEDAELAAHPQFRAHLDRAPVVAGDAQAGRQAEAGAVDLGGEERVEDAGQPGGRDAVAAVAHEPLHVVAGAQRRDLARPEQAPPHLDFDGAAARHRLAGVDQEVAQDLEQLHRIGLDRADVVVRGQFAADVGPERGQPDRFLGHHPRVEHVALAAAHTAGEAQEPPHQGTGRRAALGGVLEQGRAQGLVPLVLGQHHAGLHGREHVVEVVGDAAGHLRQRLHPACAQFLLARSGGHRHHHRFGHPSHGHDVAAHHPLLRQTRAQEPTEHLDPAVRQPRRHVQVVALAGLGHHRQAQEEITQARGRVERRQGLADQVVRGPAGEPQQALVDVVDPRPRWLQRRCVKQQQALRHLVEGKTKLTHHRFQGVGPSASALGGRKQQMIHNSGHLRLPNYFLENEKSRGAGADGGGRVRFRLRRGAFPGLVPG